MRIEGKLFKQEMKHTNKKRKHQIKNGSMQIKSKNKQIKKKKHNTAQPVEARELGSRCQCPSLNFLLLPSLFFYLHFFVFKSGACIFICVFSFSTHVFLVCAVFFTCMFSFLHSFFSVCTCFLYVQCVPCRPSYKDDFQVSALYQRMTNANHSKFWLSYLMVVISPSFETNSSYYHH